MKKYIKTLLFLSAIILLSSCAPVPPVPPVPVVVVPPKWDYEKDAIRLHLKGDPQMHLHQGVPHTLVFCLYHLIDPNAYNQLIDEKGGLEKLCECSRFDPSVTNATRFIMNPNEELTKLLDRPANSKYVGVIAGYYQLQKENVVRLFLIPVVEEKKGGAIYQNPGVLNIDLYLGPQQIQNVRGTQK
jgi:predicted component of type VI protein secretion system